MTIILTTIDNQRNNKNDNSSKVNIGPCEDILRRVYNSSDKKLYMKPYIILLLISVLLYLS